MTIFGAVLLLVGNAGAAQTIVNTADARWSVSGQPVNTRSNTVTIDVAEDAYPIETFREVPSGGLDMNYNPSSCSGTPLPAAGGGTQSGAMRLGQTDIYRAGEQLFFRVRSARANTDPTAVDVVEAEIQSSTGDRETIIVSETGENTGEFVGMIPTIGVPPAAVSGDCRLSVVNNGTVAIEVHAINSGETIGSVAVRILADPYGIVFDSEDGTPVSGATVTLIDVRTGQPATVFADDGVTPWPSTVISGEPVTDAAGNVYPMEPGEYRFPLAPLGEYRIEITPPAPYSAPSVVSPEQLANLARPDGNPFLIVDGSYGGSIILDSPLPVRVDIPVDRPNVVVSLAKTVSRPQAQPGDVVFYTVTVRNQDTARGKTNVVLRDRPSQWLRLRSQSVRIDGAPAADGQVAISDDGRELTITFATMAPGAVHRVTYAMAVRPDAPAGEALNTAEATDARGETVRTSASLEIQRETIGRRMTIIGRITEGPCTVEGERRGIGGVRVMLEDGSFAITDADGRYHFEGIVPGTHVVQAQPQTLPAGGEFVDCSRSTRNAGSNYSRFVMGQGGSLLRADFYAVLPEGWEPVVEEPTLQPLADAEAAGAETDWFAAGNGPAQFLFPLPGHNPRAPAVRVVIRHAVGQSVDLTVDGAPVDPLSFEGARTAPTGDFAVSIWRGVALNGETTDFAATIRNDDGSTAEELFTTVDFAAAAARAELLPEQSNLVADGASRPVIAVRLTDRRGRPVRAGVSGSIQINEPYESAEALARLQVQQLAGRGTASPTWNVEGDDGIAYIELAPTMVSGPLHMTFVFSDREITRTQEIESWIVPGDQEWTLVGLAEGTVGARSIADQMDITGEFDSDLGENARVAFYAKGRILGKTLLTVSYDSAKQRDQERLLGYIDPNAYYTVFADGSHRRFDAASREKLYVRIETETFYALYGDFLTGFDQTILARYDRAATGFKAEGRFGRVHVQGFAAETETRFRRDEIQGAGISGPYTLSSRAIVPNSEQVSIEVRDRFRSEIVVETRQLARFVDYDIDLLSGTITFAQPVLSRDFDLNPRFIVVSYETSGVEGTGEWNAGARADITAADGALRFGASVITDKGDAERTNIIAADARLQLGAGTEIRAEIGASSGAGETGNGWLVEAEHHSADIDVVAYVRSIDADYGTGQQNLAERGRRKFGADARYRLNENLALSGSVWRDESLTDDRRRDAVQLSGTWRSRATDLRLGIAHFADQLADGSTANSTVLEAGATQRLFDNRLEIAASSSVALDDAESIDLPARHQVSARYALNSDIRLVALYETAQGNELDARTFRAGIEASPWQGGRVNAGLGQQDIDEFGPRTFAAFGLAQSIAVSDTMSVDFTVDSSHTISGGEIEPIINPDHPVASGGQLGQDGSLYEDFFATTMGVSWRKDRWSANLRGEFRDGQFARRYGITAGAIRQLGEGSVVGSGMAWTRAEGDNGAMTEIVDGAVSIAHRPANDEFAFLAKLEYRSDAVRGAVAGELGPAGRTALLINGDANSRRLVASLSGNWSPRGNDDEDGEPEDGFFQRSEIGLFVGARYNFDSFEGFDIDGWTGIVGADARVGIGERFDIGAIGTVRHAFDDGTTSFAFGPQIGFVPSDDVLLTIGYNVTGFRDRDFAATRFTEEGIYAGIRIKFDADSFDFLGLGRR